MLEDALCIVIGFVVAQFISRTTILNYVVNAWKSAEPPLK